MSIFGTIKAAAGRGASRVEEQIEKEKRKAAEQSDTKTRERRRYDELLARGIQPSVALKTIEAERGTAMTVVPPVQRYQKVYPGRKETKIQKMKSPTKKGFMGVDWGKAASQVSSNIQTNVARGTALGGIRQPDFGADIGFLTGAKPKKGKREPEPVIKGYDMWNRPIYGKPKKHAGKGKGKVKGRDIVIHVR